MEANELGALESIAAAEGSGFLSLVVRRGGASSSSSGSLASADDGSTTTSSSRSWRRRFLSLSRFSFFSRFFSAFSALRFS